MSDDKKQIQIKSRYSAAKIQKAQGLPQDGAPDDPSYQEQIDLINRAYTDDPDITPTGCDCCGLRRRLRGQLSGYRAQDTRSGDPERTKDPITLDDTMAKLVGCRLRCHYCSLSVKVVYGTARDPSQWTLDRLDNDLGHTSDNTVIACMDCNLQRRRRSAEAFSFTKMLRISKQMATS